MILTREAPNISSKSGYDWRVLPSLAEDSQVAEITHSSLGVVKYRPSLAEEPQVAEVTLDRIVQAWVLWSIVRH